MIELKILSEVVANDLCTECGTCDGICPTDALSMTETDGGQVLPVLTESLCIECGLCDLACPELEMSKRFEKALDYPLVGPIEAAYLSQATSPTLLHEGQTGGFARTVLAWALETGRVDGVVTIIDDPDRPLRPKVVIAQDVETVLKSSRSKYCPVPVNSLLLEMLRFKGNLAYVGLSCHMQGLEVAMQRLKKLRSNVVLTIGLMCDRVLSYHFTDYLCRCAGVKDSRNVREFDYRHKDKQGWPGEIRIGTLDGYVFHASRYRRGEARGIYMPAHCRLCPDKLNVLSDLSIGDPHGVRQAKTVPTAVLVRSIRGLKFIKEAYEEGCITLEPAVAEEIIRGQNNVKNSKMAISCGKAMKRIGRKVPVFLETGPLASGETKLSLKSLIMMRWAVFSQTPRGAWIIKNLPPWVVILFYGVPRRFYRDWVRRPVLFIVRRLKRLIHRVGV